MATEATLSHPAISLDEPDARHSPEPSEVRPRPVSPCTPSVTTRLRFRIIGLLFTPLHGLTKPCCRGEVRVRTRVRWLRYPALDYVAIPTERNDVGFICALATSGMTSYAFPLVFYPPRRAYVALNAFR